MSQHRLERLIDFIAERVRVDNSQCNSSESGGDESCGKDIEGHMNSVFLLSNHNTLLSPFYPNYNHSTAFSQYPCVDACFSGLFTSHGQHAIVTGATPKRIPLPLDVAEDEPVYVNAKQYHGILRRRQHRAKLEMQNKLVKSRKPYLHESRHLHALNRVRGSGGRFLSKKLQQPEPTSKNSHCILDRKNRSELNSCRLHTVGHGGSSTSCSDISSISNNDGDPVAITGIPSRVGNTCNGSRNRAPAVP
ncbi:hypothetical protein HRI_003160300 [Hibiscus trionum]|uniref:Nuclear transcription factor Y subunit n=1 Tax=Hibiscus trionum TaxID=183268 RepID=A0A9W7ME48_HIBTR|nr:hypothetical protein HRI_003160300 [Hibiscus trionum]